MRTFNQVYAKLRRKNRKNYLLLLICNFISVLLITSFAVVMQSNTVQTMLPEGGDSRSQMVMIFTLAIVGCVVFTTYASSLFFRAKSREMGIYMALGAKKGRLAKLLFGDLALISLVSAAAGTLLGTPLAMGIWQLFRMLIVDSEEMVFSLNPSGYVWPLCFVLFTTVILFLMGFRFIRRGNIMDVVNEQRKSEPVKDVKRWYGWGGIVLMVAGVLLAIGIPQVFVAFGYTPPFWAGTFYLLTAIGLYLLLVYVVVHGFGGQKSFYRNIISRSMMKFQGRQTVLNMCVIAVLMMAAYFSMFYAPMVAAPMLMQYNNRPVDYAFHYRLDEEGIPGQAKIEQMAAEENVSLSDYWQTELVNLATDGYDREWTDDGRFGNEYFEFCQEETFISESNFNAISGMSVDAQPGRYIFISTTDYAHTPYDYIEDMKRFTNPITMETLDAVFQEEISYDMMHRYILLDDADYAAITTGLTGEWWEGWVQFNVEGEDNINFARRLKNAIIDGSTELSATFRLYDRVERINAQARGDAYFGDTVPQMQVDYAQRNSSAFNEDWRYIPMFRILDQKDFMMNVSVYLMLFIFMAIICMAAVIVIAYTRCLTIANTNEKVYDDLRHLGAKRDYLRHSVKGQVSKVFLVPALVGTIGISAYYALAMYANSGGFEKGELVAFGIDFGLIVLMSLVLYGVYRFTLKKVSRLLGVAKQSV